VILAVIANFAIALADQTVTLLTDAVARADRAEQAIAGERAQVDALRERLNAMQVQFVDAHAALQAAEAADARADRAEADRNAERERADALRGQIEAMQAQLAAEESAADQARQRAEEAVRVADALRRAEEARQGRGLLARLRAAGRGE
jgi:DNA repair exonuclease SbcCD ATPase subunit